MWGRGWAAQVREGVGESVLSPVLKGRLGQTSISVALLGHEVITTCSCEAAYDSWPRTDGQGVRVLAKPGGMEPATPSMVSWADLSWQAWGIWKPRWQSVRLWIPLPQS